MPLSSASRLWIYPKRGALVLVALSVAHPLFAQHSLELSWTEVSQQLMLIPADTDVQQLSNPERLRVMTPIPDTSRRLTGYSPQRGVYHERHVLNPYRLHEEWQASPATRYVSDRSGRVVLAADGSCIKRSPPPVGWRADQLSAMARAYAAGELEPFRQRFLPSPEELRALESRGYRILPPSPVPAARGSDKSRSEVVDAYRTNIAALSHGSPPVSLTLDKPGTRLAYDEASLTYSRIEFADDKNERPVVYTVRRYASAEHLDRGGLLPIVELRSHYDTLTHGAVVVRSQATLRRDYDYRYDGRQTGNLGRDLADELAVFPNPLASGLLTISVPEDLTGGLHLELRDASGRLVRERGYPADVGAIVQFEIADGLTPGLYHVSLSSSHAAYTAQVILTR